ncbi:CCT domain-containing protein [Cephalotus follicularis]|uniref:CCT domain-containing protein n=1 Tax=Cephalotus follicularis TaxID=3775 RepID=A0A1Q3CM36_CEPFO|nr:CCT domain-containing protein [Cephalotus follicularis]
MEPLCEFCGVVRALVYCKSDLARLCLHCDGCVHSANALSRRHPRSLLCDKCNCQPAIIRCTNEKMSLCQGCDWNGNGCSSLGHRRQALNCYTGCPSLTEFTRIWSTVFDVPSLSGVLPVLGPVCALPMDENCVSSCSDQRDNERLESLGWMTCKLEKVEPCFKSESWMGTPSLIPPDPNYASYYGDQSYILSDDVNMPKDCSNIKDLGIHDSEDLYEGLNMDDVSLNFDGGDQIFENPQRYQFEDVDTDCLLIEKNVSVTGSSGPSKNALETLSSGQQECVSFQSSLVGGSASVLQATSVSANCMIMNGDCNRNVNLGFPTGQVHSSMSLSLSNITGESSAADYQDCGLSPVFLTGESPWESSFEASCPQARDRAKMRYIEKKRTRTSGKQIRYPTRKARADTRKRDKGRFVKASEAFDSDPTGTRNF